MKKISIFLMMLCLACFGVANAQTSLFSEDFEDGSMPSGWTTDGNGSWSVATAVNSTHPSSAGHGTYCAQIKHGNSGDATKLITPEIDLSSVTSAELSFMHAQQSWSGDIDGLKVYYRTSTSGTWTQLLEFTDAYGSWTTEDGIVLPNLSSTYQLAFEYIDNYGYGLGIDYVNIVPGASCPAPQTVAASNPTVHGATISWAGSSDSYIVMVAESVVNASYDFETGSMPSAFTNSSTNAWSVVANTHSGAYCAKSAGGFTSTNSDLELTVNLATAGSVDFSALVSSESGWDFGRFLIDGDQNFEVSGTSNSWTDYSYPLTAGSHTLTWRYYKDGSGNYGDDCFYVDDIVIKEEPSSWYQYPAASSPYTLNDATNIHSATDYMVQVVGVCSGEQSNPSATVSFTTTESCPKPTNLQVTTDGATATVTWDGGATCNVNFDGTIYPSQTSGCSFPVQLSTTYTVAVEAICTGETSGYCTPVSFTTPDCIGGHTIEYTLNDSYGDGWNGNAIVIVDGCGNVIETLTIENGSSNSGTLNLCGSYYQFTWAAGSYANETSFTLTDNGTAIYTSQSGSSLTDGQVLHTIGTLVPAPTSLTAGTPGTNSVVLNWTAGGSETAWQICINGDEANLITANTNVDYTLTGLNLDTDYTVKVRAYIDANSQSCWSNTVNFTTEASNCSKPTNVTASNITINSAHIGWDGNADSYNVQYATATVTGTTLETVFFDDFENGFGNWTTYALGDYTDDTWALTNSTLVDSYHSGSYGALTRSYYNGVDVSVDNWLVSPQMTLGDVLKFWVVGDNNNYQEYFAVYVSTGTNATSDFVMVEAPELAPGDGTWAERTVDLSAYAGQQGYIAIRHTDFAQDFLILDDFGVYKTVNAYSYGTFTTLPPTTETSCDINGLNPETLYVAQVQADCGDPDGTSSWSSVYFTTPDACSAPTDLVSSNITATTATLGWSDNQDSYNVQYRKVYFYEGFESENLPTGWTTIDANEDGNTWGIFHATTHSGNNGAANFSYIYNVTGTEPDDYLVSPQLDLQGTLRVWLSGITASSYAEHFEILLSTTGNSAEDFTITLVPEAVTTNEYVEYTADLSSYEGRQGYIAIHHFNCQDQRYLYVDDFGLYGTEDWVTVNPNPTDATVTLSGLTPMTGYEWQVQGLDCNTAGSATDWSAVATFTTLAQYTKTIEAVGTEEWAEGKGGYYLIASPVMEAVTPTADNGFLANDYDLYWFNQTAVTEEWQNYRNESFDLVNGMGYLYASKEGTTLTFTGAPYSGNGEVTLSKTDDESVDFQGWNLVGNPFDVDAYIDKPFYTLENSDSYTENTAGAAVHAMQGLLVVADNDGETLAFSTVAPSKKVAKLNMNVSKGHSFIDHATISFSEGQQLPKLQFRKNSTKVYVPVEGRDYAIATAESNMGEMPVSFKAENNGSYTLSFTSEEVSFAYLHLIDNMTGNDVDLLSTPSYTFEARTTDYTSRFKLVFATGNADDNFAFYSNGSFVINNEGNATLQVIDVTGRMISSETINGCANVNMNAAPGVYMIRLINGDNVKVQKVVVR